MSSKTIYSLTETMAIEDTDYFHVQSLNTSGKYIDYKVKFMNSDLGGANFEPLDYSGYGIAIAPSPTESWEFGSISDLDDAMKHIYAQASNYYN